MQRREMAETGSKEGQTGSNGTIAGNGKGGVTTERTRAQGSVGNKKESTQEQYLLQAPIENRLDDRMLAQTILSNHQRRGVLNDLQYQIQQRLQQKRVLETELQRLQHLREARQPCGEERLEQLKDDCSAFDDAVNYAELDGLVYERMKVGLREETQRIKAGVEELKMQLRNAGETLTLEQKARDEAVRLVSEEAEEQKLQASLKDVATMRKKLTEAQQTYATLQQEIEEIKKRVLQKENRQQYQKRKEERLAQRIVRLKERRQEYEQVLEKLRRYAREFEAQYERLREIFEADGKEAILVRKERKDIQLQSEKNDYTDKVGHLQALSEFYCELKDQLTILKEEAQFHGGRLQQQRLYDKGEYNPDVKSNLYVTLRLDQHHWQARLEEKVSLVRTIISGIKHILFKLRENDRYNETGTWYNLTIIAAIDEIVKPETRPKFSKLLMILEHKITCFYTLILQKVRHMKTYGRRLAMTAEELAEREDTPIEYILERSVAECCGVLDDFANNRNTLPKGSSRRDSLNSQKSYRTGRSVRSEYKPLPLITPDHDYKKPISGSEIPRLVVHRNRGQSICQQNEDVTAGPQDKDSPQNPVQTLSYNDPSSTKSSRVLENFDMMSVNDNIFQLLFQMKRKMPAAAVTPSEPLVRVPEAELQKAQNEITSRFSKQRMKAKLDKSIKDRVEYTSSVPSSAKTLPKPKKRVTGLTIEIAEAMKNRPPEEVYLATTTFDAIDKLTRGVDTKPKRTVDTNPSLMPNFLNAILSMKKSRGEESIGKIAAKCTYYFSQPKEGMGRGQASRKGDVRKPQTPSYMVGQERKVYLKDSFIAIHNRLENVRSLNRMEKTQVDNRTVLDIFHAKNKKLQSGAQSLQQRPKVQVRKPGLPAGSLSRNPKPLNPLSTVSRRSTSLKSAAGGLSSLGVLSRTLDGNIHSGRTRKYLKRNLFTLTNFAQSPDSSGRECICSMLSSLSLALYHRANLSKRLSTTIESPPKL